MIEFEWLAENHLDVVRDLLGREHVQRWWRDPIDEEIRDCREAVAGPSRPGTSGSCSTAARSG